MDIKSSSLNARVAAACFVFGSISLHLVNQIDATLQPVRLLILGVLLLGGWAFADEMGLKKPLNRAGFVCFAFAMAALAVLILETGLSDSQKYYRLYAFTLLFALLIWSIAYMHRQRDLKIVGVLGATFTLLPIVLLIIGHISIGAAAYLGVNALFIDTEASLLFTSKPIRAIEALFIIWSLATAVLLWKGRMNLIGTELKKS